MDQREPASTDSGAPDEDAAPVLGNWLLARLPPNIADSLTDTQKDAIAEASGDASWRSHAVNIRISVPIFDRRFYFTVVGGEEKRDPERRVIDRERHPLRTLANVFFMVAVACLFYIAAAVAIAAYSTIIEI